MYVLDRPKQLIHDEDLVDVLEEIALLDDVVEIDFWGNVFQAKCLRIAAARDLRELSFEPGKTHP